MIAPATNSYSLQRSYEARLPEFPDSHIQRGSYMRQYSPEIITPGESTVLTAHVSPLRTLDKPLHSRHSGEGREFFKSTQGHKVDRLLHKLSGSATGKQNPDKSPLVFQDHQAPGQSLFLIPRGRQKKLPLWEELPNAVKVYQQALACVRRIMGGSRKGKFTLDKAEQVVADLVSSLDNNQDALLCLPRIRQQSNYIYSHSVNVCCLLAAFALNAGQGHVQAMLYGLAGLLHDVGKSLLPLSLLGSPKKLTKTEQALIKRHPGIAHDLMANVPDLPVEVLTAALQHHERFDGQGYPYGISGRRISTLGHLTAIADAYDAMASNRPHQTAKTPHRVLGIMFTLRGTQFHPQLLEEMIFMLGIYPVGSIVELKDGYLGIVTANSPANPMHPVIILTNDAFGRRMPKHEFDLARDSLAGISRCLALGASGVNPAKELGIQGR